jgi:hypothetical protein
VRDREIDRRDREIEGRDREIEGREIETEKQRDRADNKNPKQSWVAQLVYYINVQSPNLDLKLGIKPKAGNFLSRKREWEGGWGIG